MLRTSRAPPHQDSCVMHARFILKNSGDQFSFQLRAATSSEVILSSERYARKSHALEGIASVKASAASRSCFRQKRSPGGEAYFELRARNGEVVATSQMFASERARDASLAAVHADAPAAVI